MDCLICFKIFLKETEYENISPPNSDICARSICKLLEIPNSPRIEEIFKGPVICSKCYQKLEDVNQMIVQLEELERKIEEIRTEVAKDLKSSKNVSQVMQNAYGGGMSKSSKDREQLFEVVKGVLKGTRFPQDIAKNDPNETQDASSDESIKFELSPEPETIPLRITRNRGRKSYVKAEMEIEEIEESSLNEISGTNEMNLEKRLTRKRRLNRDQEMNDNFEEIQKKSNSKNWKCNVCGIKFNYKNKLNRHQLIHGPKKFKCSFKGCGKRYNRKDILKRHEIFHSEQKPFQCQYCSRGFNDKRSLIIHLGDEKPANCGICKQNFKSKGCLRHHKFIFHGMSYHSTSSSTEPRNMVKCKTCNQNISSTNIRRHELTHGKHKFKCPEFGCPITFKRRDHMNEHIKIAHEGIGYKCKFDGCEKTFN